MRAFTDEQRAGRAAYMKVYWSDPKNRARKRELIKERRNLLASMKMDVGCTDCGYNAHPSALEYDHLPGTEKCFNIAQSHAHSWSDVMAEIAKCEVVCANCHRIRTATRAGV